MKHTIRFRYIIRWSQDVEVDIPEGSTRRAINDLVDKAESAVAWDPPLDDVESDGWDWLAEPPKPATPRWSDATTVVLDGHTWACDGWAAVRSDAPPPKERNDSDGHITPEAVAALLRRAFVENVEGGMDGMTFHERYADILAYGDDRRRAGGALLLYRNDEPVALIMPMSLNYGTLNAWGEAVRP